MAAVWCRIYLPQSATLLSSPGELKIVRHPPAADYTRMRGHGKIASVPSYQPESKEGWQVDLRSCNLSALDIQDRFEDLLHCDFDSKTVWPPRLPAEFDVRQIMELGKNPGLGLRAVHKLGITGASVGIGIIDQALLVDHQEYKERLRLYEEIHWQESSPAQMHGPAVASIAVGKTVGVASGADLYFIAEEHGRSTPGGGFEFELSPLAQSIDRLVEVNKTLPQDRRIRVISISLGINPKMHGFDLAQEAISRAEKEEIYTAYVATKSFMGLGREALANPEERASYGPGHFWKFGKEIWPLQTDTLQVPMESRCTAAPTGESDYAFYRFGGMSWAVPWVAGLYALACQVKPDVTPEIFWEAARRTSAAASAKLDGQTEQYGRIIDPKGLLDSLR
jgi:hypothetical protein